MVLSKNDEEGLTEYFFKWFLKFKKINDLECELKKLEIIYLNWKRRKAKARGIQTFKTKLSEDRFSWE